MSDPSSKPPCEITPRCPICDAEAMTTSMRTRDLAICVCLECGTSLTVPQTALADFLKRRGAGAL